MHRKHFGRLGYRKPTLEHLEDRLLLTGGITELPFPSGFGQPFDIATGPDGNLWFTQETTGTNTISSDHIGRITPDGSVAEFPVPAVGTIVSLDGAGLHITAGPDGNLWYTEIGVDKIARLSPSGAVTEFPIPTTGGNPGSITAGPDGNLWFTESIANKIGQIFPSGRITEFPIPTANSFPAGITSGPDGNVWFTEETAGGIGPRGTRQLGKFVLFTLLLAA